MGAQRAIRIHSNAQGRAVNRTGVQRALGARKQLKDRPVNRKDAQRAAVAYPRSQMRAVHKTCRCAPILIVARPYNSLRCFATCRALLWLAARA